MSLLNPFSLFDCWIYVILGSFDRNSISSAPLLVKFEFSFILTFSDGCQPWDEVVRCWEHSGQYAPLRSDAACIAAGAAADYYAD